MVKTDPVKVVLLDIEGTVCSISFVKDVLYPYSLEAIRNNLDALWDSKELAPYKLQFEPRHTTSPAAFRACIENFVAKDIKDPGLKALQGFLWADGYRAGKLRAPLFDDVAPAIRHWTEDQKLSVVIYSSGSVRAQKLFFTHTTAEPEADLTPLVSGWFDTRNAGPKTEYRSYEIIMESRPDVKPAQWLFLSDNVNEVLAARDAGMQSFPIVRPGNAPIIDEGLLKDAVRDFSELDLVKAEDE